MFVFGDLDLEMQFAPDAKPGGLSEKEARFFRTFGGQAIGHMQIDIAVNKED